MNVPKKRALVADDECSVRDIIKNLLEELNFEVDSVSSGRAVYCLSSIQYDIIITDYFMPDWTGIEGIELAKVFGNKSPVLFITAYASIKSDLDKYHILLKPFSLQQLKEKIDEVIKKY